MTSIAATGTPLRIIVWAQEAACRIDGKPTTATEVCCGMGVSLSEILVTIPKVPSDPTKSEVRL